MTFPFSNECGWPFKRKVERKAVTPPFSNGYRWPLMHDAVTADDRKELASYILSGAKLTQGDTVAQFEKEWSKQYTRGVYEEACERLSTLGGHDSDSIEDFIWHHRFHEMRPSDETRYYSLFVSSGSTANYLLLAAWKELNEIPDGAGVIVPACTWMTNVSPIIQNNLRPIFIDIDPHNLGLDLNILRGRIEEVKNHPGYNLRAVFVTHLLGLGVDMEKLSNIIDDPSIAIFEDSCEAAQLPGIRPPNLNGHSLGSTFSFYFGHHMTTIEGGMVTTSDSALYDLMKMKRSHGLSREAYYKQPLIDKGLECSPNSFTFATDGYNFRNTNLHAKLGLLQRKRLSTNVCHRNWIFEAFQDIIEDYGDHLMTHFSNAGVSSFSLPLIPFSQDRSEVLKSKLDEAGVEHRPIVGRNLLRHPFLFKSCPKYFLLGKRENETYVFTDGKISATHEKFAGLWQPQIWMIVRAKALPVADALHDKGLYIGNHEGITPSHLTKILRPILESTFS